MPTMGVCYRCGAEIAIDAERGMCKRCVVEGADEGEVTEEFPSTVPVIKMPPRRTWLEALRDWFRGS